jgi:hypothetical protein
MQLKKDFAPRSNVTPPPPAPTPPPPPSPPSALPHLRRPHEGRLHADARSQQPPLRPVLLVSRRCHQVPAHR